VRLSAFRQAGPRRGDYDPGVSEPLPTGTALAKDPAVSTTSRYQAVRAVHTRATANEWVQLRPMRTMPSMAVVSPLLFVAGFPRARIAVVLAIQVALFVDGLVLASRSRRVGIEQRSLFVSHLVLVTGQAVLVALTGGLASPLWPGILGATLGTFYVFGRERESTIAGVYTVVLVVALALLPAELCGPIIARPFHVALAAWSILFTLFILRSSSVALSDAYQRIGETLARTREDVLDGATARAQGLECIGSKVAHELKNPLSAVKGLVQLLARGAVDERSRERLEVVAGEVARMETILRDYLTFARPLSDLRKEPVEIGAVADDVLAVLEARAEAAGVAMTRTGGPAVVDGDPRRLKEALLNLIANALEATGRQGSVEVAVTGGAGGATVRVRDTGKGIKPEDLARLGTPFFTTREGGTGLGVVLARAVIRQHGGDLGFESEVGRGTVATVRLPTQEAFHEASHEAAAHG
jgi:signal transduction histidine kinase